ncbi:oligoribonuclease [Candidatus Dependentiae bacterium]|nr:oligoribonuclease [Candidatus Dependentiae bacterium]
MDHYKSNLIWIDLEMTGLNPERDTILEIATTITTNELDIIAEGPSFIIHQSEEILALMDEWNSTHHGKSGLTQAVRDSLVTMQEAEQQTLEFIMLHAQKRLSPLCGNSVWQDGIFLKKYMPRITDFLHYRIIDVSSIKEVAKRWYSTSPYVNFTKAENHRAQEDIKQSIEELKHYRTFFFSAQS